MSEHHEETRQQRDELWDKTFTDNEDLDSDGHLSR
ncbi:MAG: LysM domain-containing protein, partial [Limosilactobacillus sp.]